MKKNIAIVAGGDCLRDRYFIKKVRTESTLLLIKTNIIYILPSLRGMSGRLYFLAGTYTN